MSPPPKSAVKKNLVQHCRSVDLKTERLFTQTAKGNKRNVNIAGNDYACESHKIFSYACHPQLLSPASAKSVQSAWRGMKSVSSRLAVAAQALEPHAPARRPNHTCYTVYHFMQFSFKSGMWDSWTGGGRSQKNYTAICIPRSSILSSSSSMHRRAVSSFVCCVNVIIM